MTIRPKSPKPSRSSRKRPAGLSNTQADQPSQAPAVLRTAEHEVPSVDISELKQKSVAELHQLAQELNITNYSGLRKQDLIFRIEQSLLDKDTVIRGEGV